MRTAQIIARMLEGAVKIADADRRGWGGGPLHVFIADGNCERETLEYCRDLTDDDCEPVPTPEQIALVQWFLDNLTEEEAFGAWALARADDLAQPT